MDHGVNGLCARSSQLNKMNNTELDNLRFLYRKYSRPARIDSGQIDEWIKVIEKFPANVEQRLRALDKNQLAWIYRPDGWSIAQLVHHCSDSHINSWVRFRLALTEDNPSIRPYFEDRWANLPDSLELDVADSLALLKSLHKKWSSMLRGLTSEQLVRTYVHPEHGQSFTVHETIGNYAWHCAHHLAHIDLAIESKGEFN